MQPLTLTMFLCSLDSLFVLLGIVMALMLLYFVAGVGLAIYYRKHIEQAWRTSQVDHSLLEAYLMIVLMWGPAVVSNLWRVWNAYRNRSRRS